MPVALISEVRVRIQAPELDWLKKRLATILVLEDSKVELIVEEFAKAFDPGDYWTERNRSMLA